MNSEFLPKTQRTRKPLGHHSWLCGEAPGCHNQQHHLKAFPLRLWPHIIALSVRGVPTFGTRKRPRTTNLLFPSSKMLAKQTRTWTSSSRPWRAACQTSTSAIVRKGKDLGGCRARVCQGQVSQIAGSSQQTRQQRGAKESVLQQHAIDYLRGFIELGLGGNFTFCQKKRPSMQAKQARSRSICCLTAEDIYFEVYIYIYIWIQHGYGQDEPPHST